LLKSHYATQILFCILKYILYIIHLGKTLKDIVGIWHSNYDIYYFMYFIRNILSISNHYL